MRSLRMNYKGKWALVTGASAGIGEAFAIALAERGASVVMTARRGERLNRLAAKIRENYRVEVVVVEADLSEPDAPERIEAAIRTGGGRVDILINNAGYGLAGHFQQATWEDHRAFLEVMVVACAHLARLFVPSMQERGYGRIINVASLAGLVPGAAGHTMYGAAKAFLVSFSQSLAAENEANGVKVSALCPGFTYSEFHDVNQTRALVSALPSFMFMESRTLVESALQALEAGRVVHVPGRWNKFVAWFTKALPRGAAASLVASQTKKFRRAEGP